VVFPGGIYRALMGFQGVAPRFVQRWILQSVAGRLREVP
jgi:hypothetical protein